MTLGVQSTQMNKLVPLLVLSLFLIPSNVSAHSGRTNSSGCHNCNVGSCAGTYHCHNGGSVSAPAYVPTVTQKPSTPRPTLKPTQAPTTAPTTEPVVLGVSASETPSVSPIVSQTPKAEVMGDKKENPIGGLIGIGAMGAVAYWAWKKRTPQKETTV